jgi:hypothetical protein
MYSKWETGALIADRNAIVAFALVLSIDDAQEMFQRNNVLYVYVHVYAYWGYGPKSTDPACLYVMDGVSPWRNSSSTSCENHADILDVPSGIVLLFCDDSSWDSDIDQKAVSVLIGEIGWSFKFSSNPSESLYLVASILPSRELNLNCGGNSWQDDFAKHEYPPLGSLSNVANRQYSCTQQVKRISRTVLHKLIPTVSGQLKSYFRP